MHENQKKNILLAINCLLECQVLLKNENYFGMSDNKLISEKISDVVIILGNLPEIKYSEEIKKWKD